MNSRQENKAVETDISDSRKGSSQYSTKQIAMASSVKKKIKCCSVMKMFMMALTFSFTCKALSGVIMKSSITQIERRFGTTTSEAGLIDGSFEIGNLLVITLVSHFGAKSHIPRIIGIGCFITGIGSFLTALPHFLMGHYRYNSVSNANPLDNSTVTYAPCSTDVNSAGNNRSSILLESGCKSESGSHMWIYVMIGNLLRGIGESPIGPLGLTYIDNFSKEGHSTFYVGILHSISMIGPIIGYLLGSLCAKLYVDIGSVDLSTITINPNDSRWVGAWWLGFLIAGVLNVASGIPFFYFPKNLKKARKQSTGPIPLDAPSTNENVSQKLNFKDSEQAKKTDGLAGTTTMPFVAISVLLAGYISKKLKLSVMGIVKLLLISRIGSLALQAFLWILNCGNQPIAGLTVTYNGNDPGTTQNIPFSFCNSDCNCDANVWDPVCGDDGLTYMSPCLAGCEYSVGHGKDLVFHNCSCIEANHFQSRKASAHLGQCSRTDDCSRKFIYFMTMQTLSSFFFGLGGSPKIMLAFKNVEPELKSLALGLHFLVLRAIGGILAPIYFGAAIDSSCLKWATNNCGDKGACRMYDSISYRNIFFSLCLGLHVPVIILNIILFMIMKKKYGENNGSSNSGEIDVDESNLKEPLNNNIQFEASAHEDSETHI
uniref:Solute carrier organic anion transporter family member n=1 Tax=Vombatus ursinus TaxID=29139 RepID=A0A4X2LAN4_VOMUR